MTQDETQPHLRSATRAGQDRARWSAIAANSNKLEGQVQSACSARTQTIVSQLIRSTNRVSANLNLMVRTSSASRDCAAPLLLALRAAGLRPSDRSQLARNPI